MHSSTIFRILQIETYKVLFATTNKREKWLLQIGSDRPVDLIHIDSSRIIYNHIKANTISIRFYMKFLTGLLNVFNLYSFS